jgi:hypothetical protein
MKGRYKMGKNQHRWLNAMFEYFDSPGVRAVNHRPLLTDADFHRNFYSHTSVKYDTCGGVRRVLCEQLRLCNTTPTDNVSDLFPDIDIGELCFEIGEEFGLSFPDASITTLDGTVDSLIRETQRQRDDQCTRVPDSTAKSQSRVRTAISDGPPHTTSGTDPH